MQRRHQKIVEEAPAPGLARAIANAQAEWAAQMLQRLGYDNIDTMEMLMDGRGDFTFLEMNTRLQVEHGVTEAVTGTDLVVAQIRAAAGGPLSSILPPSLELDGHAGVKHNVPGLRRIVTSDEFRAGHPHTGLVAEVLARNA